MHWKMLSKTIIFINKSIEEIEKWAFQDSMACNSVSHWSQANMQVSLKWSSSANL